MKCDGCATHRAPKHLRESICADCGGSPAASHARQLAAQCGAKVYHGSVQVSDHQMYHGIPMDYIYGQLGNSLGHAIVKDAPKDLVVERKAADLPFRPVFDLYPGHTEFKMEALVFSEKSFAEFVERLLKTYGNQFADAALSTKKRKLKAELKAVQEAATIGIEAAIDLA